VFVSARPTVHELPVSRSTKNIPLSVGRGTDQKTSLVTIDQQKNEAGPRSKSERTLETGGIRFPATMETPHPKLMIRHRTATEEDILACSNKLSQLSGSGLPASPVATSHHPTKDQNRMWEMSSRALVSWDSIGPSERLRPPVFRAIP
jgi:hypothetical protein